VRELRRRVADLYYVEQGQVLLIFRGRVLVDELRIEQLALKQQDKMNISIDCPK
jgi:ribosomal protein L29